MRGERSPDNHLDPQVKKLMRVGLGVAGWVGRESDDKSRKSSQQRSCAVGEGNHSDSAVLLTPRHSFFLLF